MLGLSAFGAAAALAAAFVPSVGNGANGLVGGGDSPSALEAVQADDGAGRARNPADPADPVAPPPAPAPRASGPRWMVGDLHVHVSPPDDAGHSTMSVGAAIDASRRSGLDFVILTPHDADKSFPPSEQTGGRPLYGQELVRKLATEKLAESPTEGADAWAARPILVIAGWEWTREQPGHLGVSFAEIESLAPYVGDAKAERALAVGGLVVINHPYFRPVKSDLAVMRLVSGDRRWRPFFGEGDDTGLWNAIEVWHDRSVWIERLHANSAERFPDTQMVTNALGSWDAATLTYQRRIAGVGGSDAHGRLPYTVSPMAMVSVLVESPDEEGLRRGLLGARVTFGRDGGAAARTFTATTDVPGERAGIGDSIRARSRVQLSWTGEARLIENGMPVGTFEDGTTRDLPTPGGFAFWRIEMPGEAYSNMIYANLP